jgi:membrane protein implicated in regulation of membrane protease activity
MRVLKIIALSIAVIIGSLFLVAFSVCAFVPGVEVNTRVWGIILALADIAAIVAGIRAIIKLNKRKDDNLSIK